MDNPNRKWLVYLYIYLITKAHGIFIETAKFNQHHCHSHVEHGFPWPIRLAHPPGVLLSWTKPQILLVYSKSHWYSFPINSWNSSWIGIYEISQVSVTRARIHGIDSQYISNLCSKIDVYIYIYLMMIMIIVNLQPFTNDIAMDQYL